MTRSLLTDAFDHHVWATLRLIEACRALTPDQLVATVPGTYGPILETLRHLVGADAGYLSLMTDGRTPDVSEDELDLDGMRAVMERHGEGWASVLAGRPDPEAVVVRHRDDGSQAHATTGVRLAQAVHHGTDHRSHVCTGLTLLGVEPPAIDVWDWAWETGRFREVPPPG